MLRHIAALAAMASLSEKDIKTIKEYKKWEKGQRTSTQKNKYGLTQEQVEQMKTMSPKEKKKFLKELDHDGFCVEVKTEGYYK